MTTQSTTHYRRLTISIA